MFRPTYFSAALLVLVVITSGLYSNFPLLMTGGDQYDADVLILGAGMAGITAAKTLHERGHLNFIIIEARDRVGGRMRSQGFHGVRVELGANWVQAVDPHDRADGVNPIWKLAQRCQLQGNFSTYWESVKLYNNGNLVSVDELDSAVLDYYVADKKAKVLSKGRQLAGLPGMSVRKALTIAGWSPDSSPAHKFIDWFNFDFGFGEPANTTSFHHTHPEPSYEAFGDGEFFVSDSRGYEYLLHCLAKDVGLDTNGNDLRLRLNTTVTDIHWSNDRVCIEVIDENASHTMLCGKKAISTFSIGVLKNRFPHFHPPLPKHKIDAIEKFNMTHMLKIYVKFNHSFWDQVEYIGQVTGPYHLFQPIERLNGKFNLPSSTGILLVTLMGKDARDIYHQNINRTKEQIMKTLKVMYPDKTIPEIQDILVPSWITDPLYMGTYSSTPIGVTTATYNSLTEPLGSLYFSGEATSEHYHSYVHGAYLAGIATVQQMLG